MKASDKLHVVVVGAGIVGSSIAFNLARRSVRVTVVDSDEPAQGASLVSFAWANGRDKNPRHYHDLNRRSVDMWYRLTYRLGIMEALTWGGELRWAATDQGEEEIETRVRQLQSWGYPIRILSRSEVKELEPDIVTGDITAASYTDIEFHVDTSAVIRACLDEASGNGTRILTGTSVTGLLISRPSREARIEAVSTVNGDLECDVVVLAGGADTAELASYAGLEVPFNHTFGATVITEAGAPVFQNVAVVHTPRDRNPPMNLRQFRDGSVMIHGGSRRGPEDESLGRTQEDVEYLLRSAAQYLPSLERTQIKEIRRGRRPMPVDGHPVLGFSKAVPNLYLAAMHSGVSLAALVGEFSSTEIVDGARIDILEPYRVERFS